TINSNNRKILEDEDAKIETKSVSTIQSTDPHKSSSSCLLYSQVASRRRMSARIKYKQQNKDKECRQIAIFKNNLELIQEQNLTDFEIK
ncbi:37883_t:CDS:1, partial [Gigaspora margarita]